MIQDKLIQELSQELQMEEFIHSSERDHYTLLFDEDIKVEVIKFDTDYLFKGTIAPCPTLNSDSFLTRIMEANLFGRGTSGAAMGLNETENLLTLSREVDYNCTYKDFKKKLEEFVNCIDFWRKEALKHQ